MLSGIMRSSGRAGGTVAVERLIIVLLILGLISGIGVGTAAAAGRDFRR